jgi:ABC-type hemin transport system ATPase subunit
LTFAAGRVTVQCYSKGQNRQRVAPPGSTASTTVARRELAEVLLRLDATTLMVTHDLPFALQLCPRSIVLDDGAVVADGPTRELLADEELLRRHRLELPYGFVLS